MISPQPLEQGTWHKHPAFWLGKVNIRSCWGWVQHRLRGAKGGARENKGRGKGCGKGQRSGPRLGITSV